MTLTQSDRQVLYAAQAIKRRQSREAKRARVMSPKAEGTKLTGAPGEQTKRKAVPVAWQLQALGGQRYRCAAAGCDASFSGPTAVQAEFDHVNPIALGGEHAPGNIQAICPKCHLVKTRADISAIAKAKRRAKKHFGPREPSRMKSRGFG